MDMLLALTIVFVTLYLASWYTANQTDKERKRKRLTEEQERENKWQASRRERAQDVVIHEKGAR